jgi:hypothetical protein
VEVLVELLPVLQVGVPDASTGVDDLCLGPVDLRSSGTCSLKLLELRDGLLELA